MSVPIELETEDWQDVRFAVVMVGGVSLTVWISGVTLELSRLVGASRAQWMRAKADEWAQAAGRAAAADVPGSAPGEPGGRAYGELLELLKATARIDVIAGTSAGGVNAGFLALGLVHECDLRPMGELWEENGGLVSLLRSPMQKNAPSLLRGDDYFLPKIRDAYQAIYGERRTTAPHRPDEVPVELFMTTTLLAGKQTTFTDDQGTPITETDYAATLAFANRSSGPTGIPDGNLADNSVLDQLAAASRCTSSFPAAFEPHWVKVDRGCPVDGRWASEAGLASFPTSQFVIDGGVLLNKPIRPALAAVYRQSADRQVRRILAYVVPDPGSSVQSDVRPPTEQAAVPPAANVVLSVFTRLRAGDSVSHELDEIRTRNTRARDRRAARSHIVTAVTGSSSALAEECWTTYRRLRARIAGRWIGEVVNTANPDWSVAEVVQALSRRSDLPFVPEDPTLAAALERSGPTWTWGVTTAERLGAMAVDILKRAMWLTPMDDARQSRRSRIRAARKRTHDALSALRDQRSNVDAHWRSVLAPQDVADESRDARPMNGPGPGSLAHAPGRRRQLDAWLAERLRAWRERPPVEPATLWRWVRGLACILADYAEDLRAASAERNERVDPGGEEARRLSALVDALLPDRDPDRIVRRMLELDVVQLAFSGATDDIEQEVELVEVSAARKDRDGRPTEVGDKLTGVQLYHFGAFYRRSWRVNDWLQGRMDGIARLVEIVLSPERLRQLGYCAPYVLERLRQIALGPAGSADRAHLETQWDARLCGAELAFLDKPDTDTDPLPSTLPACARAIARRLQTEMLSAELTRLAHAILAERECERPVPEGSRLWLAKYQEAVAAPEGLSARVVWDLFGRLSLISAQQIVQEVGSDHFAQTTSGTAAVLTSTIASTPRLGPAHSVLRAVRGYTLVLWALVELATSGSRIGINLVNMCFTVGAAIIALSVVAPGFPSGVTLAGVAAILAGATTVVLLTPKARGLAWRIVPFCVLFAAILAAAVYFGRIRLQQRMLMQAGVVAAVIVLGAWIGRVNRRSVEPVGGDQARSPQPKKTSASA